MGGRLCWAAVSAVVLVFITDALFDKRFLPPQKMCVCACVCVFVCVCVYLLIDKLYPRIPGKLFRSIHVLINWTLGASLERLLVE